MATKTGIAMAAKPMTNMVTRAVHCVTRTLSNPSCSYHSQSAKRLAKVKNATTRAAITARVMPTARRSGLGVAWFGAEVVVTPPS